MANVVLLYRGHTAQQALVRLRSRGQTSPASPHCCKVSGTISKTLTLAMCSSHLTATGRCGGYVISVQMAILMHGRQQLPIGQTAQAAPTVQVGAFANTTPCRQMHLPLLLNGAVKISSAQTSSWSAATSQPFGSVIVGMNGQQRL